MSFTRTGTSRLPLITEILDAASDHRLLQPPVRRLSTSEYKYIAPSDSRDFISFHLDFQVSRHVLIADNQSSSHNSNPSSTASAPDPNVYPTRPAKSLSHTPQPL
ncbi:hypothetical protein E4U52_003466 [Claviceps spartinae]|nr:hypothetical protein E4U52_003466 [Claviceps spartinae]